MKKELKLTPVKGRVFFSLLNEEGATVKSYGFLTKEELKEWKKRITKAIKEIENLEEVK